MLLPPIIIFSIQKRSDDGISFIERIVGVRHSLDFSHKEIPSVQSV